MHEKKWRPIARTSDRNKGIPMFRFTPLAQNTSQHSRSGGVVKDREWGGASQLALDQRKQLCRQDGVATQRKEIIVRPNLGDTQYTLPKSKQSFEHGGFCHRRACERIWKLNSFRA